MIAYVLTKEISGEKILQDINKLLEKFKKNNNNDVVPILTINIKTITNDNDSLIPKLTYKEDCST